MSEKYCISVEDVYGAPLSDLRAPEGWEFTGEFRPVNRGESFLSRDEPRTSPKISATGYVSVEAPRLILRKERVPTVEAIYGGQSLEQLRRNTEKIEGFKWTGEFRKVKEGDWFLGATGGVSAVQACLLFDGEYRLILEKIPTIKDIYEKELSELVAPEGWRFTGEFRKPLAGEPYLSPVSFGQVENSYPLNREKLILEKLPANPTIEEIYGTPTPEIPKGWRFKEFREVNRGEPGVFILGNRGHGAHPVTQLGYGPPPWRIVLEKELDLSELTYSIPVEQVYSIPNPSIPEGYRVIGFRLPRTGESYLSLSGDFVITATLNHRPFEPPRLILEPR